MSFIEIKNLSFEYSFYNEEKDTHVRFKALDNINLSINEGEFIGILGHNGSGKSTLAKHFSGILTPPLGKVFIDGKDVSQNENLWNIRKKVGNIFQNPDNQLVTTIVEDDIAFGVENLGLQRSEIIKRIDYALKATGIEDLRRRHISTLSGGQKQRVAIAGVLAMNPKCIVLDEPTSMLNPKARHEIINTIKRLNKENGITIILVTHFMEEVVDANRLVIMEKGKVCMSGKPMEVFKNIQAVKNLKIDIPEAMEIAYNLKNIGVNIDLDYLKIEDLSEKLIKIGFDFKNYTHFSKNLVPLHSSKKEKLKLEGINYIYNKNSIFENHVLKNINLSIEEGDILGIIGQTGSGKSTLIQVFNGLLKPDFGKVYLNREEIFETKKNLAQVRQKVGVVFQYPEYQLFEETVFKDVCFGPMNMQLSKEEVEKRAEDALTCVGLDKSYYSKSPFDLSGGEKRRVAIAGILSMKPEVLVFDELTAGLDPMGRKQILKEIKNMNKNLGVSIILVSHSMEDVTSTCDKIIALNKGEIALKGDLEHVFKHTSKLDEIGLDIPVVTKLILNLNKYLAKDQIKLPENIYTVKECTKILSKVMNICS